MAWAVQVVYAYRAAIVGAGTAVNVSTRPLVGLQDMQMSCDQSPLLFPLRDSLPAPGSGNAAPTRNAFGSWRF